MSIARRRKARKTYRCDGCGKSGKIQYGDVHLQYTLYAQDDGHHYVNKSPVRGRECADCATRHGRAHLLEPETKHDREQRLIANERVRRLRSGPPNGTR